jgi:hypothetical protein
MASLSFVKNIAVLSFNDFMNRLVGTPVPARIGAPANKSPYSHIARNGGETAYAGLF